MPVYEKSGGIDDAGSGLLSLSLEFSSIDHAPQKKKPMPQQVKPVRSEVSVDASNVPPQLPAVDLSKVPVSGAPIELVPMVHERSGWPCHTLFERGSWALHLPHLEMHNRKPGMRVIIAKAETHGPKTTPYTLYVMHIKTAFSVRGISRRFSEFKDLDDALRAVKRSAPTLPRKKTWGKMSPKFITERKRQLQNYVEAILSDPTCADSEPFRNFLGTNGHPIEQDILKRYSSGLQGIGSGQSNALLTPWRLASGTRVEAIEALVQRCRSARDVRQEARAFNQLGIMHCQQGDRAKALQAMRQAFMCCRQLDDADGLVSCALSWASIHAFFGEYRVAEQRLLEAEGMAAEFGAISGQGWCHLLVSTFKAAQGLPASAAKEATLAAELFCNAADYGHTALAHFMLGSLLLRCGEVRQAVEVLESSLLLRRRARDTLGLGESLSLLGQAFAEIGYLLHAMDYFDQALALCQETGNRHGEAICLRHLGRVHHLHGNHHEALTSLDKSLTLFLRRDDVEGQAQCHEYMASVHLDLGDARQAIQHFEESLSLFGIRNRRRDGMGDAMQMEDDVEQAGADRLLGLEGGEDEGDLIASVGTWKSEDGEVGAGDGRKEGGAPVTGDEGGAVQTDLDRVEEKLRDAKVLIEQATSAYEDYDKTLRQDRRAKGGKTETWERGARQGEGAGEGGGGDDESGRPKRLLIDTIAGKDVGDPMSFGGDVVQPPSVNEPSKNKNAGPKFPLKFKMKMPGQDMSSHFKFLQSWTVHKKYYQTSDLASQSELAED